jgi:hypothetical protein
MIGVQEEGIDYYILSAPEKGNALVLVRLGDTDEYQPARFVFDLESAIDLAKFYAVTGQRAPDRYWEYRGLRNR